MPRALVLVQGTFDPARIEAFIQRTRGHDGRIQGTEDLRAQRRWPRVGRGPRRAGSDCDGTGRSRPPRRSIHRRARRASRRTSRPTRDDDPHPRQRRQHGMGRRAVRRDQPPHAAAERRGRAGAARAAGVGQGATSTAASRRRSAQRPATKPPPISCATSSAGSSRWRGCRPEESPSFENLLKIDRALGHRHDRSSVVRASRPKPFASSRRSAAAAADAGSRRRLRPPAPQLISNLGLDRESRI